jgi:hypothetical protein
VRAECRDGADIRSCKVTVRLRWNIVKRRRKRRRRRKEEKKQTVQPTATAFFARLGDSTVSTPEVPSLPAAKKIAKSWLSNKYVSVSMQ